MDKKVGTFQDPKTGEKIVVKFHEKDGKYIADTVRIGAEKHGDIVRRSYSIVDYFSDRRRIVSARPFLCKRSVRGLPRNFRQETLRRSVWAYFYIDSPAARGDEPRLNFFYVYLIFFFQPVPGAPSFLPGIFIHMRMSGFIRIAPKSALKGLMPNSGRFSHASAT